MGEHREICALCGDYILVSFSGDDSMLEDYVKVGDKYICQSCRESMSMEKCSICGSVLIAMISPNGVAMTCPKCDKDIIDCDKYYVGD